MRDFIIRVDDKTEPDVYVGYKVLQTWELIRCEKCKHGGIDTTSYPQYWCSAHSEYHIGDWFCADGERKEKDEL